VKKIHKQLLLTLGIVAAIGSLAGWATFSAFSGTTSNSGNSFSAGTVVITDNDAGSALYNVSNQAPGATLSKCIKVTFTGSLDSTVKMYASSVGAVGQYINLTVTPGSGVTGSFPSCTGFSAASGGSIYNSTLKGFADTYTDYASGLSTFPDGATKWVTNDAVWYKFDLTLQNNNSANGGAGGALSTGSHSFTWEAQNQ
jgi:hypothetical protein